MSINTELINANAAETTFTMPAQDVTITANFVVAQPPLVLECSVSPNPTKVGHITNFTASASGGVPPYYWSWTVDGTEIAATQNATHIFATAGNYIQFVLANESP